MSQTPHFQVPRLTALRIPAGKAGVVDDAFGKVEAVPANGSADLLVREHVREGRCAA
jgi:hypothetical protein